MHERDYQEQKIDLNTWRSILSFASNKSKKNFLYILIWGMVAGVLELASSYLSMWAIDGFISPGTVDGLWLYITAAVATQALVALSTFGYCRAAGRLEAHLTADVRQAAFTRLQTMDLGYFDRSSAGYLIARLTNDIMRTMEMISWSSIDIGWGLMAIIASMIGMFVVNLKLAAVTLVCVPLLVAVSVLFQKKILRYQRDTRKLNSMITSRFNEGIMGAQTTKTLGREELNESEFYEVTGHMRSASMRAARISAVYMPVASLIISFTTGMILISGGYDVTGGLITVGQLNFFINIGNMMFEPIRRFADIFAEFQSSQAAAERVTDILMAEPGISDSPEIEEIYGDLFQAKKDNWEPIKGSVDFENVSFHYVEGEEVLSNFSLHVDAGENIALVGETGGGKSTIVSLICRFYEPQSGRILVDGIDIRERSQLWLQSSLGYVLQTPHLFSGTILENIRYGRLEASDEEVFEAAKLVGADEFISQLEKGYGTEVGEGGGLLSTGQKQLISFARAILADPRIFILDEATSSVDTESELKIQNAISVILKNRTSFIIAHRLSTVKNADRILVIDHGRISESGTHSELMAKRGRYYELYTNQFRSDQLRLSVSKL